MAWLKTRRSGLCPRSRRQSRRSVGVMGIASLNPSYEKRLGVGRITAAAGSRERLEAGLKRCLAA